jgi:thiamine-monophosphate kinase
MTNSSSDRRSGEFEIIAKYFAPLAAGSDAARGLTDDAAFVRVRDDEELVVTVDALTEDVHFLRDDPPGMIGAKALRVNLSDLAAKGATPAGYLLALCLPDWTDDKWIAQFAAGLAKDQSQFGVMLIGGDTTATPGPLTISITALGRVSRGKAVHRSGARPDDLVFVSGAIGDAGAGLALLKKENGRSGGADEAALIARYRLPEPRLSVGKRLIGLATAALDVSDGLVADLIHIAEVSRVRIAVDALRVPLSPALVRLYGDDIHTRAAAATAGDDYEIAFTAPADARDSVRRIAAETGVAISEIGHVEVGSGTLLLDRDGHPVALRQTGYVHF